ncbi:phospholipase D-like domain-containing protein [Streptomyces sp. NPDC003038]|uniref:phospholipase D-like domain-containing protein n=1 Tax=unclassified Streptomyces TaxID=2593676 RepID=UPI00339E049B
MHIRTLGRIAAATALAAAASLLSGSGAHSADYMVRNPAFTASTSPVATFNNPRDGRPDEIKNHLIDLIDHAEPGTKITGSVLTFNDNEVGNALVAAHKKGVKVRLILDSHSLPDGSKDWLAPENVAAGSDSEFPKLYRELGVDRTKDSFVYVCPRNRGCIGARPEEVIGKTTLNHNKFFLFEKVGAVTNLVFQSSANLTGVQLTRYYNNAVTIPSEQLLKE